ncbi:MAG: hypothetical protein IPM29_24835 [Planctomycetes bacterium]|nr:hypothetical protein [Planctomycetota bacterium]
MEVRVQPEGRVEALHRDHGRRAWGVDTQNARLTALQREEAADEDPPDREEQLGDAARAAGLEARAEELERFRDELLERVAGGRP